MIGASVRSGRKRLSRGLVVENKVMCITKAIL